MYLDRCKVRLRGKLYTRILLRQSYRHEGKVKHRAVANLSKGSAQEIKAIELALKHKHDFSKLTAELSPAATPRAGRQTTLQRAGDFAPGLEHRRRGPPGGVGPRPGD